MIRTLLILLVSLSVPALADQAKPSPFSGKLKKMKPTKGEKPSPDSSPSPQKD